MIKTSRFFKKGGSNFPGKVAIKIAPDILKTVAKDYNIILITGTNGKTTTTSMIYNMIKDNNKKVITNNTGANLFPGIVTCFVENYKFKNTAEDKYAVIEVDEANLKFITQFVSPKVITVTNLFRDQLDRYGEVYTTLKKILEGIQKVPETTLVLNGDESLLGDLGLKNKTYYYGFTCSLEQSKTVDINADAKFCKKCKAPYKYNYLTYSHLGDYYCDNCGYKRPDLDHFVNEIKEVTSNGSLISIDGNEYYISQPGIYNIYNALCAYSVGKTLSIDNSIIFNSLKSQKSSFGRQEVLNIDNKEVKIILVKNPAGYDEAINTVKLDNRKVDMCFILNDNYADGRDVSWIWDVKFEQLANLNINKVNVAGIRLYDMAVRLKVAGLSEDKFTFSSTYDELLQHIKASDEQMIYILATYTAMIDFRKFLQSKGYIKKFW